MKIKKLSKIATDSRHRPDYFLIINIVLIVILGLVTLTSASSAVGHQRFGDSYYFIKRQLLFGLLPGVCLFLFFYFFNYQLLKKLAVTLLLISIILLISVFIPGIGAEYGTAHSWIHIAGFSFQPSELVKLTFLIYLANWLEKRGESGVRDFYYGFLPFLFLIAIISTLMMLQPDLGTLAIIIFMCFTVFFASGAQLRHVFGLITVSGVAIYFLIKAKAYRTARLMTFLHPELDPQGIGYHINQAFLAIGSGGLWGRGFGHSRQKFQYLPEVTSDSIFAIYAEEMGLLFSAILLILYLGLMYRGLQIAKRAPDVFGRLLATGIIAWLMIQTFFNIGAMVGLLPITGVPLPFVSSGGTSLAMSLAAVGILTNISKHTKTI